MNKKYSHQQQGVSITEHSQPKGIKPKMRERKLRSGVNRQGALEQEVIKQVLPGCVNTYNRQRRNVQYKRKEMT